MTAAFPRGGAAHLFRATGSVAPVSAAPPGELAARLAAKKQKSPVFRLSLTFYLMPGNDGGRPARYPPAVAAQRSNPLPADLSCSGERSSANNRYNKSKRPSLSTGPFALFDAWRFPTLTWGDPTLPSALRRFTSEFGMGSGGTTALVPPGKFCFQHVLTTHRVICIRAENLLSNRQNIFGVVRLSLTVH